MCSSIFGPAVQATRAQTDKNLYEKAIQEKIKKENIQVFDDEIKDFATKKTIIEKAISENNEYVAKAFVLTTGTFLNGAILIGHTKQEGGRIDEKKSTGLEKFFENNKLQLGRLKTGTPPRLSAKTINYKILTPQPGDEAEAYMSFLGEKNKHPKQTNCHITQTNEKTHKIIEDKP